MSGTGRGPGRDTVVDGAAGHRSGPTRVAAMPRRPPGSSGSVRSVTARLANRRTAVVATAVVVSLVGVIVMLWPVMAAPVHADDRYWYLRVAPESGGSYLGVLSWTWDELPTAAESGRLAPIASISRRLVGLAVMQFAVATSTPVVVLQGVVKLVTFALGIGALLLFCKSLRSRGTDGRLVGLSGRTLAFVGVAAALLAAAGSQAHSQFRNGWTSYAVLTWGAVVVVFGVLALVLWLLRLVAEHPRRATAPAVVVLVLVALFLNLSYELVYVAAPAVLLVLLLQPVGPAGASRREQLQPRLVVGGSFLGAFTVLFLSIRWWLSTLCAEGECYPGVEPQLTTGALRTMVYNLVGSAPVARGYELRSDLERVGLDEYFPVTPTGWSVLLGLLVAAALVVLWFALRVGRRDLGSGRDSLAAAPAADRRAEGRVLLAAALVCVAVAVGEAAVMGLSVQAEELITQPGLPYRNTMITWAGLAFSAVLLATAGAFLLPGGRLARRVGLVALAVALAATAAVVTPANAAATLSNRLIPQLAAVEAVHWEVVLGDRDPAADARRCAAIAEVEETMGDGITTDSIVGDSERAFEHFHGRPFCAGGT